MAARWIGRDLSWLLPRYRLQDRIEGCRVGLEVRCRRRSGTGTPAPLRQRRGGCGRAGGCGGAGRPAGGGGTAGGGGGEGGRVGPPISGGGVERCRGGGL